MAKNRYQDTYSNRVGDPYSLYSSRRSMPDFDGSAAPKIHDLPAPVVHPGIRPNRVPQRRPMPEPRPIERPGSAPQQSPETIVVQQNRHQNIYIDEKKGKSAPFLLILNLLVIAVGAIILMQYNSDVKILDRDIAIMESSITELTIKNEARRAEADANYNLKELETYAINVLGMTKPQEHQIIRIRSPRQTFVSRNYDVTLTSAPEAVSGTDMIDYIKAKAHEFIDEVFIATFKNRTASPN